jgi:hypothetical protein
MGQGPRGRLPLRAEFAEFLVRHDSYFVDDRGGPAKG